MSLFESLGEKDSFSREFNRHESVCGVLLSIIARNGTMAKVELSAFNTVISTHEIFAGRSKQAYQRMVEEILSIHKQHGWEVLAEEAARHVPEDIRSTVFALAVDLVFADRKVDMQEEFIIERIQRILKITDDDAKNIVNVLAIKNGMQPANAA